MPTRILDLRSCGCLLYTSIRGGLSYDGYVRGKKLGYQDAALRRLSGTGELPALHAVYKMVDTCSAEFDAGTPYFYSAYDGECEARAFPRSGKPRIIVLGSGPIRIGQGIEFDYSSVHCVRALKALGYEAVSYTHLDVYKRQSLSRPTWRSHRKCCKRRSPRTCRPPSI